MCNIHTTSTCTQNSLCVINHFMHSQLIQSWQLKDKCFLKANRECFFKHAAWVVTLDCSQMSKVLSVQQCGLRLWMRLCFQYSWRHVLSFPAGGRIAVKLKGLEPEASATVAWLGEAADSVTTAGTNCSFSSFPVVFTRPADISLETIFTTSN